MGQPQFAGLIGGVPFEELPGSPQITCNTDGTVAVRRLRIEWSDQWTLIAALTDKRQQANTADTSSIDYPGYPGSWANNDFIAKLQIEDIEIEPSWDGNQEGITVDATNNNIGSYDLADVTITYRLTSKPSRRAVWTTRTSAVRPSRIWKYAEGLDQDGPANPTKYLPDQEIMIPVYPYEWDRGIGDNNNIFDLSEAEENVGLINSDKVQIGFGREIKTYPANSLLFASFEVENVYRYTKADHVIMYRFIVAPAYLSDPPSFDGTDLNPWMYVYSPYDNDYQMIEHNTDPSLTLFEETPFATLFPWGATV